MLYLLYHLKISEMRIMNMLRIVICCGAGMSSSYLTKKLQLKVEELGLTNELSFEFFAMGMAQRNAVNVLKDYDVALCCPHLKMLVDDLCKNNPDLTCAMHIFPPKMYGTLPYEEVVQEAKDVLENFQKEHKNPVVFPGESMPIRVTRGVAWSHYKK